MIHILAILCCICYEYEDNFHDILGTLGLLLTVGVLATLNSQQVFAAGGGGGGAGGGSGSGFGGTSGGT
jgi:hypothetical protein